MPSRFDMSGFPDHQEGAFLFPLLHSTHGISMPQLQVLVLGWLHCICVVFAFVLLSFLPLSLALDCPFSFSVLGTCSVCSIYPIPCNKQGNRAREKCTELNNILILVYSRGTNCNLTTEPKRNGKKQTMKIKEVWQFKVPMLCQGWGLRFFVSPQFFSEFSFSSFPLLVYSLSFSKYCK